MILDTVLRTEPLFTINAINTVHDFHWDEHYAYYGEIHDFPEIVYVVDGEVEATENEQVYHMKKGDWILHDSMEFHNIRSVAQTKPHVYIISFYTQGGIPEKLKNGVFALSVEDNEAFCTLFRKIQKIFPHKDADPYQRHCLALELSAFMINLSLNHSVKHRLSSTQSATEYRNVVQAMQRGIYDNLTLADLSKECHISVSYIKALFNHHTGSTPKQFYAKLRRTEALRLLSTGMTVTEVAEKMNFSSQGYFSLFMKRNLGMSLREYLKTRPAIF